MQGARGDGAICACSVRTPGTRLRVCASDPAHVLETPDAPQSEGQNVQISLPHLATHEAVDLCKVLHLDLVVVRFFERFVAPALKYFEDYIVLIRNINSFSIHKAMQIALSTGQSAPLHL
ncbi:hypothetical protein IG631_11202 [Alternaria alternata]|nr:hypothetical protein IG631_11202 [Alternaria alternata]